MEHTAADRRRAAFLVRFGDEMRGMRESAELTQQEVADWFGWHKDAISKIETGKRPIALFDYLLFVQHLWDVLPPRHPAQALVDRYARYLTPTRIK